MLKKLFVTLIVFVSGNAMAGNYSDVPVEIFYPDNDPAEAPFGAYGSFNSARFSDNDIEVIGCGVRRVSDDAEFGGPSFGFCQARDATDAVYSCATFDLDLMESVNAASTNSFVLFYGRPFDPANPGEIEYLQDIRGAQQYCTVVQVSTQSMYIFDSKELPKDKK